MKTKIWIIAIALLLVVSIGLSVWLLLPGEGMERAEIWSDGKLLFTVDLRMDQEKTVSTQYGTNVITVKDGKIAVTQADCPDHYCTRTIEIVKTEFIIIKSHHYSPSPWGEG